LLTAIADPAYAAPKTIAHANQDTNQASTSVDGAIAVIYPDVGEPYRSVFAQIVGGIEDKAKGRVVTFPVGAEVNAGVLNDALRRQGIKVVIALGRQGMKAAAVVDRNIAVRASR